MGRMPDICYAVGGLTVAGTMQHEVAAGADRTATALSRIAVLADAFGTVSSAAPFAAAADRTRLGMGRAAAAEMAARTDLAGRVHATACLGTELEDTTEQMARSASPMGPITAGML